MALPASGQITLSEVNVELGYSSTAQIGLGDAAVRTLAGVPSGAISLDNLHGKANQFAFTISSNQTNANLATLATSAGWNGTSKVVATIGSGVYISSNSTGTPALTISGSFPGGVELVNNGYIVGMGGAGGKGEGYVWLTAGIPGSAGSSGGLALSVASTISITNNGTIGGGGGGGGGGKNWNYSYSNAYEYYTSGGGGGGGGRTGTTNSAGGAAGLTTGGYTGPQPSAGSQGTASSAGSGGAGAVSASGRLVGGTGGTGGGWGASGSTGGSGSYSSIGYGTTFTTGGPFAGGSAGGAVTGNSNITWIATGTRLGSIS